MYETVDKVTQATVDPLPKDQKMETVMGKIDGELYFILKRKSVSNHEVTTLICLFVSMVQKARLSKVLLCFVFLDMVFYYIFKSLRFHASIRTAVFKPCLKELKHSKRRNCTVASDVTKRGQCDWLNIYKIALFHWFILSLIVTYESIYMAFCTDLSQENITWINFAYLCEISNINCFT